MTEKIRRDQHTLVILGNGVIVFGIWSFVKTIAIYLLNPAYYMQQADSTVSAGVYAIAVVIVLAVDLLLRLFVGTSARNAGLGKKTRAAYIAAAVILVLVYVISTAGEIYLLALVREKIFDYIITLIIDVTSLIILLELIVASVKVRIRSRHAD